MKWLFSTASGQADCALGHQGQFICTWPDLDVIIAITSRDSTDYTSSCELLDLVASGLDFDAEVSSSLLPLPQPDRHNGTPQPAAVPTHTRSHTRAGSVVFFFCHRHRRRRRRGSRRARCVDSGGIASHEETAKSENVEGAAGTELAVQTAAAP